MFSEKLLSRLKSAYSLSVLTGAGISAESGVPTFRGKDGLWKNYRAEELATPTAFQKNPKLFWEFYCWRRKILKNVKPNLGHYALVDLERLFPDFLIITQNVDNLHSIAGNKKVIEIHGNIMHTICSECGAVYDEIFYEANPIPSCKKCSAMIRPDVVLFGETLDEKLLRKAQETAANSEVFFSIGTSGVVEPAASLPFLAKANGSYVVEVNETETPLSMHANECLRGAAGKILPQLIMILEKI
jgi:NAD-dependent deacetylase